MCFLWMMICGVGEALLRGLLLPRDEFVGFVEGEGVDDEREAVGYDVKLAHAVRVAADGKLYSIKPGEELVIEE